MGKTLVSKGPSEGGLGYEGNFRIAEKQIYTNTNIQQEAILQW